MASTDPMGGGGTVAFDLTGRQRSYLRGTVLYCKAGREDDLRTHPDDPRASKWRAEADAYGRLIAGLDTGKIAPDAEVRRLVRELAAATDREEEYERVVFEHDALAALCVQIGAER